MPMKMGFSWVESAEEGKKLESLRNSSLVEGSSTIKLRHSSFWASASSLWISLSRYWTRPHLSKWWSCSVQSGSTGRLKNASLLVTASATASSYSSISLSGPYGSNTSNWMGASGIGVWLGIWGYKVVSFLGVWKSDGGGLTPPVASSWVLFPRVWVLLGVVVLLSAYDRAGGEQEGEGD